MYRRRWFVDSIAFFDNLPRQFSIIVCVHSSGHVCVGDEVRTEARLSVGWHCVVLCVQLSKSSKDASIAVSIDGIALPAFRHSELCNLKPVWKSESDFFFS